MFGQRVKQLENIINNSDNYRNDLSSCSLDELQLFLQLYEEIRPLREVKLHKVESEYLDHIAGKAGDLDRLLDGTLLRLRAENEVKFKECYDRFDGQQPWLAPELRKNLKDRLEKYSKFREIASSLAVDLNRNKLMERYSEFISEVKQVHAQFEEIRNKYHKGTIDSQAGFEDQLAELDTLLTTYSVLAKKFKPGLLNRRSPFDVSDLTYEVRGLRDEFKKIVQDYDEITYTLQSLKKKRSLLQQDSAKIVQANNQSLKFEDIGEYKPLVSKTLRLPGKQSAKFSDPYIVTAEYKKNEALKRSTRSATKELRTTIDSLIDQKTTEIYGQIKAAPSNLNKVPEHLQNLNALVEYVKKYAGHFDTTDKPRSTGLLRELRGEVRRYTDYSSRAQSLSSDTAALSSNIQNNKRILKALENNKLPPDYEPIETDVQSTDVPLLKSFVDSYNEKVCLLQEQQTEISEGIDRYKRRAEKKKEIESENGKLESAIRRGDHSVGYVPGKYNGLGEDKYLKARVEKYEALGQELEKGIKRDREKEQEHQKKLREIIVQSRPSDDTLQVQSLPILLERKGYPESSYLHPIFNDLMGYWDRDYPKRFTRLIADLKSMPPTDTLHDYEWVETVLDAAEHALNHGPIKREIWKFPEIAVQFKEVAKHYLDRSRQSVNLGNLV